MAVLVAGALWLGLPAGAPAQGDGVGFAPGDFAGLYGIGDGPRI